MKKQTKGIVWTIQKVMQFVQTPQKTQTKINKAHRCIYVSFQVIVFHYKQNTLSKHKKRNKTKTKK